MSAHVPCPAIAVAMTATIVKGSSGIFMRYHTTDLGDL